MDAHSDAQATTLTTDNGESQLIADILDGQIELYEVIVERYHRGLINYTYNMVRDADLAEDIAQEAFLQAYRKLHQYKSNYAFSTWLYKIASNLGLRHIKRNQYHLPLDSFAWYLDDDKSELPADTIDREQLSKAVRAAVEALTPHYQQVIALYYWQELSYEEIAVILDRPIGTVRTWLHRAKNELGKELYGQAR